MINEIANDYLEYLKVDLSKEVALNLRFIISHISSCHVLVTACVEGLCCANTAVHSKKIAPNILLFCM
jgi:hypothetical protein